MRHIGTITDKEGIGRRLYNPTKLYLRLGNIERSGLYAR
jgi:hypothetical protein